MTALYYGLQPAIIVGVLLYWLYAPSSPLNYPLTILAVHLLLGTLEYLAPARRDWLQPAVEKLRNLLIVVLMTVGATIIAVWYSEVLAAPLSAFRESVGLDIWPHDAPLLLQVFAVFFLSELVWYWMHRAEHRWTAVWRVSGHGAHHSFKRLGAINFGTNHPLELFFITLPSALVELFFGVGIAAAGATVLTVSQASIAHANINMNWKGIGWLFTTNRFHIQHHSSILEESNTNYGCAAIVWDRVFGTFADRPTVDTGTGPTEPSTWAKLLMPIREPEDTSTAPYSRKTTG